LRIEAVSDPGVEVGSLDVWSDGEVSASGMARSYIGTSCTDATTGELLSHRDGERWVRAMEIFVNSDGRGMWVATLEDADDAGVRQLVAQYVRLRRELRARHVLRADRALVGELAEHLAECCYGIQLETKAVRTAFDGTRAGAKVQVKARIVRSANAPTAWAFGERPKGFDILLAFLFDADYNVLRVLRIPVAVVQELAVHNRGRWSLRWNETLRHDRRVEVLDPPSAWTDVLGNPMREVAKI